MPAWAWGAVIALVQIVVVGLIVALRTADQDRISKLEQWIKDKEKFDYEFRHDEYAHAITDINMLIWTTKGKMEQAEKTLDELREWKHVVIDPWVPRAIEEHERRINKIDAKVFNGGNN